MDGLPGEVEPVQSTHSAPVKQPAAEQPDLVRPKNSPHVSTNTVWNSERNSSYSLQSSQAANVAVIFGSKPKTEHMLPAHVCYFLAPQPVNCENHWVAIRNVKRSNEKNPKALYPD